MAQSTARTILNTGRGAAQGAAIGSVVPGIGTAIGAGVGAVVGTISSLFGDSEEEQREERIRELVAAYEEAKQKNRDRIFSLNRGRIADARQAGARKAASLGITGDVDQAFTAPTQQNILSEENRDLAVNDQFFDNRIANARADYAERPLEPSISDALLSVGDVAANYVQQAQLVDQQAANMAVPTVAPVAASTQRFTPDMTDAFSPEHVSKALAPELPQPKTLSTGDIWDYTEDYYSGLNRNKSFPISRTRVAIGGW